MLHDKAQLHGSKTQKNSNKSFGNREQKSSPPMVTRSVIRFQSSTMPKIRATAGKSQNLAWHSRRKYNSLPDWGEHYGRSVEPIRMFLFAPYPLLQRLSFSPLTLPESVTQTVSSLHRWGGTFLWGVKRNGSFSAPSRRSGLVPGAKIQTIVDRHVFPFAWDL